MKLLATCLACSCLVCAWASGAFCATTANLPQVINGEKAQIIWFVPTDVQSDKVTEIAISFSTALIDQKLTLQCTGGKFKATNTDLCEFTTKKTVESNYFTTIFIPDTNLMEKPCLIRAVANGQVIGEWPVQLHRVSTIEVVAYSKQISADGSQNGALAAIVKDQFGSVLDGVPTLMVCTMPGGNKVTVAGSTDTMGTSFFSMPPSKIGGDVEVKIIAGNVTSESVKITYRQTPYFGLTATIAMPHNISISTEKIVPILVSVTSDNGTPIPESVLLRTDYGTFSESRQQQQVLVLRDGIGKTYLEVSEWTSQKSMHLTAHPGTITDSPIGQAMAMISFPSKVEGVFLKSGEPESKFFSALAGRVQVTIRDQFGRPVKETPLSATLQLPYPDRVYMHGTTDVRGQILFPVISYKKVPTTVLYVRGMGYAIPSLYAPLYLELNYDKQGHIRSWGRGGNTVETYDKR